MVIEAGGVLLRHFGRVRQIRQKENASSVVCEADLASEARVIRRIRRRFPSAGIIAEESGLTAVGAELTFVIDPLDGTSNFVAGLPWFGAQVGVLREGKPVCAAMFLPVENTLYVAEAGGGVWRNGERLRLQRGAGLKRVLCAFGLDPARDAKVRRRHAEWLCRLAGAVRNIRTTNSLFDFCYTLEGRLGGCINLNCKIWDIVPILLMLPEAGGDFRSLNGDPIELDLGPRNFGRSYQVLGAAPGLLRPLLRVLRGSGG